MSYEGLQLTSMGEGTQLVRDDGNTYGGKWLTNPSGGLLSESHPMGATGLTQAAEIVWQLTWIWLALVSSGFMKDQSSRP